MTYGFALFGALAGTGGLSAMSPPPLAVSRMMFYPVGLVLCFLTAAAAYFIWTGGGQGGVPALRLYILQLMVMCLWPWLFFRLHWQLFAFFWGLLLLGLISLTMAGFRLCRPVCYWLMLPYLLWTLYTVYLNLGYYLLNSLPT